VCDATLMANSQEVRMGDMVCGMEATLKINHPILDFFGEIMEGVSSGTLQKAIHNLAALDTEFVSALNPELINAMVSLSQKNNDSPINSVTSVLPTEKPFNPNQIYRYPYQEECFVPSCSGELYSKGMCRKHYQSHRLAAKKGGDSERKWLNKYGLTKEDVGRGQLHGKKRIIHAEMPDLNQTVESLDIEDKNAGICGDDSVIESHVEDIENIENIGDVGSIGDVGDVENIVCVESTVDASVEESDQVDVVGASPIGEACIGGSVDLVHESPTPPTSPNTFDAGQDVSVCLTNCGKRAHSRGLCSAHYQQYRIAVREGIGEKFLSSFGIDELPRGKKGRRPKTTEDMESKKVPENVELTQDLQSFKGKKELKLTSVNLSELIQFLGARINPSTLDPQYWYWTEYGGGRVHLDAGKNSLTFFTPKQISWEAQLFEKAIILEIVSKFNLRYILIDGDVEDKVMISKFRNYYLLPETPDERFTVRAKKGWDSDVFWELGDIKYVEKFKFDGLVVDAVSIWLVAPPCWDVPSVTDPMYDEWERSQMNLRIIQPAEKVKEFFDIEFNGKKPLGSHPELIELIENCV